MGNIVMFGLNVATFRRVYLPTSLRSRRVTSQRRDVEIQRRNVLGSLYSQRRNVEIQRRDAPKSGVS